MDPEKYSLELLTILRRSSAQALSTLNAADTLLPEKASAVMLGVHPNQEPDGMFSVMIHLEGPDVHVLNKSIDGKRYLFDVKFVDEVFSPDVPMFDPFDTDFEVNDVIVDTALVWLEEIWSVFDGKMKNLPTTVFGEDGYGTKTPKKV